MHDKVASCAKNQLVCSCKIALTATSHCLASLGALYHIFFFLLLLLLLLFGPHDAIVARLTQRPDYAVRPRTFVSPSADSRRAVRCQLLAKYAHLVSGKPLMGLSVPRKSMVRLTDHPLTIQSFDRF